MHKPRFNPITPSCTPKKLHPCSIQNSNYANSTNLVALLKKQRNYLQMKDLQNANSNYATFCLNRPLFWRS